MQNQVLSMMLDMMMAGLLLATIIYCLRLNKRIQVLQDSKSELARIIREFDESTTRATQNISEIHAATDRISENIQLKIDKANFIVNDLDVMIERAGKMTGKAETAPARTPSRSEAAASTTPRTLADVMPMRSAEGAKAAAANESAEPRRPLRMRSRAEQELMNLLGSKKAKQASS